MEIQIRQSATAASLCTVAFTGTSASNNPVAYTAGHCGNVGQVVYVAGQEIGTITQSKTPPVGPRGEVLDANAPDWAVISLNSNANPLAANGNVSPRSLGEARVGDAVCSQGRTTGWRCGEVTAVDGDQWIHTSIRRDRGDSGGPLIRTADGAALGILSSSSTVTNKSSRVVSPIPLPDTGSLGGGNNAGGASRYFSLKLALAQAGGYKLATVGESLPDATRAPRNIPVPDNKTPELLPSAG